MFHHADQRHDGGQGKVGQLRGNCLRERPLLAENCQSIVSQVSTHSSPSAFYKAAVQCLSSGDVRLSGFLGDPGGLDDDRRAVTKHLCRANHWASVVPNANDSISAELRRMRLHELKRLFSR